jgi:signal transduction histidine kinase
MERYELDPSSSPIHDAQAERMILHESFRHLEHAPIGIVVVHGDAHTIVYANASFRQSSGLNDSSIVGRPIAEILENSTADVFHNVPRAELVTILDRVRSEQIQARDVNVSQNVGMNTSVNISAGIEEHGVWRYMVWPVRRRGAGIDQLIVGLWSAREDESSIVRQRDIAERLLLSVFHERELSEDNARLYEVANDARAVAEEAQLHAEGAQTHAEDAQHAAEEANSAKAQFLANMSHELRTPLNAISGYAQLMEMGLRGTITDAQRADLERIRRSGAHLLGLINTVLNYAKLESGQVIYATQSITLNDVLADVEALVHPQLRAKGLRYQYEPCIAHGDALGTMQVHVKADAEKLRQILLNLLTNAIKFTEPGGQITVACWTGDKTAYVSVSDTGRGIPADKLQAIFEPFVQVGRGLSSSDAGIGLGLAISRDLAVAMGGHLTVESIEGEGSTFTVVLPLAT